MIGIFDSGFGGLSVLSQFSKLMPSFDYLYLADSARAPYGDKTPEEILRYSVECTRYLFENGASIVIIACNTAMVHSIKIMQNEIYPERKILGVTIPGAEKVAELSLKKIGVLATAQTVKTRAYKDRIHFLDESVVVQEIEAPLIVPYIERGLLDTNVFEKTLTKYLDELDDDIEGLVLGCTHYSLIKEKIVEIFDGNIKIIDPSEESAIKFSKYLEKHPEINLAKNQKIIIRTTGEPLSFRKIGSRHYDFSGIDIEKVTLWK